MGRKTIGDRPMTSSERAIRTRTTKRDEVVALLQLAIAELLDEPQHDTTLIAHWLETAIQRMPK